MIFLFLLFLLKKDQKAVYNKRKIFLNPAAPSSREGALKVIGEMVLCKIMRILRENDRICSKKKALDE